MPWDQLGIYMYNHGCQVMPVRGDGICFLNAIDLVLYCDHTPTSDLKRQNLPVTGTQTHILWMLLVF